MLRKIIILFAVIVLSALSQMVDAKSDCRRPIVEIFRQASPSVVLISSFSIDPFKTSERFESSLGSGFIISRDGHILTNSHVVFGTATISVTLEDGSSIPAELLGEDPILDLAVLHIRVPADPLPVIDLGDSDKVQVGEEVLAIGNPMGLGQTLTRGIVSGINRQIPISPMGMVFPMIQTDTAINPGNSGGPLLNQCGEVIGINSVRIFGAENISFAVPINTAKQVLPQLLKTGRVIRPWLGIRGKLIKKDDLASLLRIPLTDGFLVEVVDPGSPAEKAGVKSGSLPIKIALNEFLLGGDIIKDANGLKLDNEKTYQDFIHSLKIGAKVELTIFREGQTMKVDLNVVERPILPWDLP